MQRPRPVWDHPARDHQIHSTDEANADLKALNK
jgi:hypothetical protein